MSDVGLTREFECFMKEMEPLFVIMVIENMSVLSTIYCSSK